MRHVIRLAGLAALLAPAAAMAQMQTYYHAGAWDAFSGRNETGGAVCGIGNTDPDGDRRLSVTFDILGTATNFSASKPDWSIPADMRVNVVMQVGLSTPWTEQGIGRQHAIDWTLDPDAMQAFDQQFRNASSMTLTFPDGNEPPWTISLSGSTMISDTFARCVRDLTAQVEAAQSPPNGASTQQPNGAQPPGATQPFSSQASVPPAR